METLARKVELKSKQYKITKLQLFDSSFIYGKSYFENDETQNCFLMKSVF